MSTPLAIVCLWPTVINVKSFSWNKTVKWDLIIGNMDMKGLGAGILTKYVFALCYQNENPFSPLNWNGH